MLTLKEWRRAKGVSVEKLAEALGVSPSTVNNWENRGQKIPVDMAIRACNFLGIKIDDVIFLSQNAKICSITAKENPIWKNTTDMKIRNGWITGE